jgi:hypothetical protein
VFTAHAQRNEFLGGTCVEASAPARVPEPPGPFHSGKWREKVRSCFPHCLTGGKGNPTPAGRPGRRGGLRPRLEALEDRCVPSTLLVNSSADDVHRAGTLRYAVAHAQDGDVIQILPQQRPEGAVGRHIMLTHGELFLDHTVRIESVGGGRATIDGINSSRVFEIANRATVDLLNLNIINGDGFANNSIGVHSFDGYGGGILNEGELYLDGCYVAYNIALGAKTGGGIYNASVNFGHGRLDVSSSTVEKNSARAGGGIYNDQGELTIMNTHMDNNFATAGGGAIFNRLGDVSVGDTPDWDGTSTLSFNHAQTGGAVETVGGFVGIDHSILEGNTAVLDGGALANVAGKMEVSNSILQGNSAGKSGGAIYNEVRDLTVSTSSLLYNSAKENGGGITSLGGTVVVSDRSGLFNNSAVVAGGGIYDHGSTVTVGDSTVDQNSAEAGGGIYNDNGTLTVNDSHLVSNSASFFGGGISTSEGAVAVTSSELVANSAPVGGGIFNSTGTVEVGWTLFHNTPDNIFGPYTDLGSNTFM